MDQPGEEAHGNVVWAQGELGSSFWVSEAAYRFCVERSLNHNRLFLCSSHVLGPPAHQAKPSVPSWRSLRSSCLSELLAAKM